MPIARQAAGEYRSLSMTIVTRMGSGTLLVVGDRADRRGASMEPGCARGDGSGRKAVAEHRPSASGLFGGRLILQHVPVLIEEAVPELETVGGDPRAPPSIAGEASVHHGVVAIDEDQVVLVVQRLRGREDEVE